MRMTRGRFVPPPAGSATLVSRRTLPSQPAARCALSPWQNRMPLWEAHGMLSAETACAPAGVAREQTTATAPAAAATRRRIPLVDLIPRPPCRCTETLENGGGAGAGSGARTAGAPLHSPRDAATRPPG